MPCLNPMPALRHQTGAVTIKHRRDSDSLFQSEIELPCGRCGECRAARIRSWAIRGFHESQTNLRMTRRGKVPNNCFVTLTYDQEHHPKDGSLKLEDWQNFMKALRRRYPGRKISYLACGEYGPKFGRCHMHACLFGVDFHEDKIRCENTTAKKSSVEWTSKALSDTWKRGTATLGPLTFATAAYTAGYVLKKQTSDEHVRDNAVYGQDAQPLTLRKQEFNTMSKGSRKGRMGLGGEWIKKYWSDVYPKDSVEVNGMSFRPPPYYDKYLKETHPEVHDQVLEQRKQFVEKRGLSNERQIRARRQIFLDRRREYQQRGDL